MKNATSQRTSLARDRGDSRSRSPQRGIYRREGDENGYRRRERRRSRSRSPYHAHKRNDGQKRVSVRFVPCHLMLRTDSRSEMTTVVVAAWNPWYLVGAELVALYVL